MSENLRPWFRLWHRRLRASATWQHLDSAGRGAYIDLIMEAWDRGGPLPNNSDELRFMTTATEAEWDQSWPVISRKFQENGDGELRNQIVDEELAHKEERANKGRAAANKRWGKDGSACKPKGMACKQEQEQEQESTPQAPQGGPESPRSKPTKRKAKKKATQIPNQTPGFRAWYKGEGVEDYKGYPRKKKPDEAARAYNKRLRQALKKEGAEAAKWPEFDTKLSRFLIERVRWQMTWNEEGLSGDPAFLPYPASWINGGSFNDEPDGEL